MHIDQAEQLGLQRKLPSLWSLRSRAKHDRNASSIELSAAPAMSTVELTGERQVTDDDGLLEDVDSNEYPSGFRLWVVVISLVFCNFLVALDLVGNK